MARTQAADYEQRRQGIVDKAADLFARTGFRGASVADLALACETSKSLIYHYYPSKEDILHAVMASHLDQLVEDVRDATAGDGSAKVKLAALIHAFMRHYVGAAARQKVLLNELGNLPEDKRVIIVAKQREIVAAVQRLLEQLDPSLADDQARGRVKTMLLFGAINWIHTWFRPDGPLPADDVADMVVAMAFGATPERRKELPPRASAGRLGGKGGA